MYPLIIGHITFVCSISTILTLVVVFCLCNLIVILTCLMSIYHSLLEDVACSRFADFLIFF